VILFQLYDFSKKKDKNLLNREFFLKISGFFFKTIKVKVKKSTSKQKGMSILKK